MNIRSKVKWIATTVCGLVVLPIISSNVETFATEHKWDRFLTDYWSPIMSNLADLAQNPWYIWAFGVVTGIFLALWGLEFLPKQQAAQDAQVIAQPPTTGSGFNSARQRQLTKDLRSHASEHTTLKIMIADVKHRPLADKLISIFHLAGWRATLAETPLENYIHRYHEGIEVKGYNAHFLETIVDLLKQAGLPALRSRVEELQVPHDNPKWPFAQHTIKITIGHH